MAKTTRKKVQKAQAKQRARQTTPVNPKNILPAIRLIMEFTKKHATGLGLTANIDTSAQRFEIAKSALREAVVNKLINRAEAKRVEQEIRKEFAEEFSQNLALAIGETFGKDRNVGRVLAWIQSNLPSLIERHRFLGSDNLHLAIGRTGTVHLNKVLEIETPEISAILEKKTKEILGTPSWERPGKSGLY